MASNYCTIVEKMDDYEVYVYRAKKTFLNSWIKEGRFKDYTILSDKDLAEECNLNLYDGPLIIILDGDKHYMPKMKLASSNKV